MPPLPDGFMFNCSKTSSLKVTGQQLGAIYSISLGQGKMHEYLEFPLKMTCSEQLVQRGAIVRLLILYAEVSKFLDLTQKRKPEHTTNYSPQEQHKKNGKTHSIITLKLDIFNETTTIFEQSKIINKYSHRLDSSCIEFFCCNVSEVHMQDYVQIV